MLSSNLRWLWAWKLQAMARQSNHSSHDLRVSNDAKVRDVGMASEAFAKTQRHWNRGCNIQMDILYIYIYIIYWLIVASIQHVGRQWNTMDFPWCHVIHVDRRPCGSCVAGLEGGGPSALGPCENPALLLSCCGCCGCCCCCCCCCCRRRRRPSSYDYYFLLWLLLLRFLLKDGIFRWSTTCHALKHMPLSFVMSWNALWWVGDIYTQYILIHIQSYTLLYIPLNSDGIPRFGK